MLGTNGLTAYFGLLDVGQPQAGETVVVSAASGSVGHLVGQIARSHGLPRRRRRRRPTPSARMLTEQLGFDAAVNHRDRTFRDAFKAASGDGIDVYFDNTGGDILARALRRMQPTGGSCAAASCRSTTRRDPAPGPRGIPGLLVNNRVRMEGFLVFDFADRYAEARQQLRAWIDAGDLVALTDELDGLEVHRGVRRPSRRRRPRHRIVRVARLTTCPCRTAIRAGIRQVLSPTCGRSLP